MKKPQRSFVVERKSAGRKQMTRPNSIWGDVDLKSVARDVQENGPDIFQSANGKNVFEEASSSLSFSSISNASLTGVKGLPDIKPTKQESSMADENTTAATDTANAVVAPKADKPKKTRMPRAKKASAETASVSAEVAPSEPAVVVKRGRKPAAAKVAPSVATAVKAPAKKQAAAKQVEAKAKAPAALDEMADLLALEEENQKLRKALSEKLRQENADLRKRLAKA